MTIQKNPDKLTEIDRKLGITIRECKKCRFRFHVLPKQKSNFRNKKDESQERNDICFMCEMEKIK